MRGVEDIETIESMLRGNSIKLLTGGLGIVLLSRPKTDNDTRLTAGNSHPELAQAVAER